MLSRMIPRMTSIEFLKSSICNRLLISLVFFFFSSLCVAQDIEIDSSFVNFKSGKDTVLFQSIVDNNPNKAALYSAVLPGLGQIYNKQAWKVPIIYGGAIIFAHFIRVNHEMYNQFRTAQIAILDNDPSTINPFEANRPGYFTDGNIARNTEFFRRNRDFMIILASAFYLINIAEAHIAAHLKEFDVNDALSLSIEPSFESHPLNSRSAGLSLVISF